MAQENAETTSNENVSTETENTEAPVDDTQAELEKLRAKNQELLSELGEKRSTLRSYQNLGDPDTLAEQLKTVNKVSKEKEKTDNTLDQVKSEYQKQLEEKDNQLNNLKSSIVQQRVENELDAAIREAKGYPELLKPIMKSRVQGQLDENGDVQISVLNSKGHPMLVGNGSDAGIQDLVEEYKNSETYSRAFQGSGRTGTGTRQNKGGTTEGNPFDRNSDSYNVTEGMKLYKENPEKAKQLMKEAGFPMPGGE